MPSNRPLASIVIGILALLMLTAQAPVEDDPPASTGPSPAGLSAYAKVAFRSAGTGGAEIAGYLRRPATQGAVPAVVAMHGCGGVINARGQLAAREADWGERWIAAGYAVLLVDSFNPRGFRQVCTVRQSARPIVPWDRAHDAAAAISFLAGQPGIDAGRVALVGWSHGAMAALWSAGGPVAMPTGLRTVVAFYPGCSFLLRRGGWQPRVPTTMLVGGRDDWTAPGPCRDLAGRTGARIVEYANAYHGFDAPNSPVRVRSGLGSTASGTAHVGTDREARAAAIEEVARLLVEAFK